MFCFDETAKKFSILFLDLAGGARRVEVGFLGGSGTRLRVRGGSAGAGVFFSRHVASDRVDASSRRVVLRVRGTSGPDKRK